MQAVATAGRPSGNDADHHLGHEADEPLALEDVQAPGPRRVDGLGGVAAGVLVAVPAADALVTARAERPAAVARRGAVAGEQHDADVTRRPGVVEGGEQLVDGVRAEGVAHLGAVERDAHGALIDGAVVGDVGERETGHRRPPRRIEELGDPVVGHASHVGRRRYRAAVSMPQGHEVRIVGVDGLPEIAAGDDLAAMIAGATALADGDIVVVTSKVVSKSEGRRRRPRRDRTVAARRPSTPNGGTRTLASSRSSCDKRHASCA